MLSAGGAESERARVVEILLCICAVVQLDTARQTVPLHSTSFLAASLACARHAWTARTDGWWGVAALHTLSVLCATLSLLAWDIELDSVSAFVFFSYFLHGCDCVCAAVCR